MEKTEQIEQMTNLQGTYLKKNLNNESLGDKSVFFGTGLASTQSPSLGFGIDVLSTILSSLKAKRILGAREVLHLISTTGYNISEDTRDNILLKQQKTIEKIIRNLGLQDEYRLILSSDFLNTPRFLEIKKEIGEKLSVFDDVENFESYGTYTILQTAICRYLYEQEGAILKVGWCLKEPKMLGFISEDSIRKIIESGHLNETYFDNVYRYVYPNDNYSFIYTPPAIGLDGRCSPPYTVTENDARPLIDEDIYHYFDNYINLINNTDNSKKRRDLKKKIKKSIENLRKTIVEPYEELYGCIEVPIDSSKPEMEIVSKVGWIQQKVLEDRIASPNIKNDADTPDVPGSNGNGGGR